MRLLVLAVLVLSACQATEPLPKVAGTEDLGAFPLPSDKIVGRDGTGSGLIGGRMLWTFGDTFGTEKNPVDGTSVWSATAGWSSKENPLALEHAVADGGLPTQFVPYTDEELQQNRADPLNGWALWPLELFDTGSSDGLVLFDIIRRENGSGFTTQGTGTARIAPGAYVAVRGAPLFVPPEKSYGSGGSAVIDGKAYLFFCETLAPLKMGCKMARAELTRADERGEYEFWDGSHWQPDSARAAVFIEGVGGGLSVSFNAHLGRYLAVSNGLLESSIQLFTAKAIEGPWQSAGLKLTDELPPADGAYNYLAREHPALASEDGKSIVISYARPLGNFRGEVRLVRITFE